MNIVIWAVLFTTLAAAGLGHAQGTMSGMTNSMRSSPLTAPAGQGQGPHDIGKELTADDRIPGGNREEHPDSNRGANPGTVGGGVGANSSTSTGVAGKGGKPATGNSRGTASQLR